MMKINQLRKIKQGKRANVVAFLYTMLELKQFFTRLPVMN